MLCTPPAFILSQDQTLEIIVLKHRLLCDPIFLLSSLALSFFYFCLSSILICKNFRDPFQASYIALYFSLVVQFSRIISLPFLRQLDYYTTFFPVCQYLFQKFFDFFQSFFRSGSAVAVLLADSLIIISLCTRFVKGFCKKNQKNCDFVKNCKTET